MSTPGSPPPEQAPPDRLIGRTIAGKFTIERLLGSGAMGAVYRARQIALEKPVAIKVLNAALALDPTFVARFAREAKAAARLDHPNSIRVFDFGQEPDGLLYIAMELAEGTDLAEAIQRHGAMSPERIVHVLSQVLAALAVAHEMGVLHRDLKPANVLLLRRKGDDGEPIDVAKVCDFGIAKIVDAGSEAGTEPGRKHLTAGLVVGTPEYMSPEQARGERVDARSDLYSVGVILYQMLTARVPFEAETALSVVIKHVTEEPAPPSAVYAGVNAELEAICLKALSKKPGDRFPSAAEMRMALLAAIGRSPAHTETIPAPPIQATSFSPTVAALPRAAEEARHATLAGVSPAKPPPRPRRSLAMVAASAGLLLAVAVLVLRGRPVGHPEQRAEWSAPRTQSTTAAAPTPSQAPSTALENVVPETPPEASAQAAPAKMLPAPPTAGKPFKAKVQPVAPPGAKPAASVDAVSPPSVAEKPAVVPEAPVTAAAAPLPPPVPPPAVIAPPPAAAPEPSAYDPASARVLVQPATHVTGTTAASFNRALAGAGSLLTACYRSALPRMNGSLGGEGVLHVETDGDGTITDARLAGPLGSSLGGCFAEAVRGRRIANVDTGSASADVPLVFRPR